MLVVRFPACEEENLHREAIPMARPIVQGVPVDNF
jgi:hypothetical protein